MSDSYDQGSVLPEIMEAVGRLRRLWLYAPEELDPRDYRAGYRALAHLFAKFVDLDDRDSVLAAALAVYGWMPRILSCVHWNSFDQVKLWLDDWRNEQDRAELLANLAP